MSHVPEHISELVTAREAARAEKNFTEADQLRAQIEEAGFTIKDEPNGTRVEPAPRYQTTDVGKIPNTLKLPATQQFSIHVLYEGFIDDLQRFLGALEKTNDLSHSEVIVVDNCSKEAAELEHVAAAFPRTHVVHLDREVGWAAARNAGIKQSAGAVIILVDLSIEPTGDILTPLRTALADPAVGLAGPFGLVSHTMRLWAEDDGPEVDALEGYLLATKRGLLQSDLICEKFKWYRNADIDLSFQLRSKGTKALVVPLPVRKHVHRGWDALDEDERARRSKKNHYTFFDRWKTRTDLLTQGHQHEA